MKNIALIATLMLSLTTAHDLQNLRLVASWNEPEYEFPSQQVKQATLISGQYVPGNSVMIDVEVDYRTQGASRVFVTIPRFRTGVPVTLGTVTNNRGTGGPLILPYPNYAWHSSQGRNCDEITSVFRVKIDECHRLWVIDTGRVGDEQLCPPQILIFNLDTDVLLHRYKVPLNQIKPGVTLYITPVLDVRDPPPGGSCSNTMAYLADVSGFSILVFDLRRNLSWRVQNKLFFPYPTYGTFTIAGETFDLMDGIFGMALSPKTPGGSGKAFPLGSNHYGHQSNNNYYRPSGSGRTLYFHSLASITENSVPLSVLDNSTQWQLNVESVPRSFRGIGSRDTQATSQAMDSNGNLFFGLIDPIAVGCWDSTTPYKKSNIRIVAQNDQTLQFSSGVKVVRNKRGKEELWVLSCRFQKVMTGSMNANEVNFRIQAIQIDELLNGNRCATAGVAPSTFTYPTY